MTRQIEQDGRRGCHLEIPHCLGRKPREGPDSKGAPAQAWDFVVHPDTVQRAAAVPGVMEILTEVVGWALRRWRGRCVPLQIPASTSPGFLALSCRCKAGAIIYCMRLRALVAANTARLRPRASPMLRLHLLRLHCNPARQRRASQEPGAAGC